MLLPQNNPISNTTKVCQAKVERQRYLSLQRIGTQNAECRTHWHPAGPVYNSGDRQLSFKEECHNSPAEVWACISGHIVQKGQASAHGTALSCFRGGSRAAGSEGGTSLNKGAALLEETPVGSQACACANHKKRGHGVAGQTEAALAQEHRHPCPGQLLLQVGA